MNPPRVLQVVEATFAGVGRHVLDLSAGLIEHGFTVDLCYGAARAEPAFLERVATIDFGHVGVIPGGRSVGLHDLRAVRAVRGVLAEHPYDIVHGHASKGGAIARLAGIGRSPSVVFTPNALITMDPTAGRLGGLVYGNLERLLARLTDATVYVSPEEEAHAAALRLRPGASSLIPNGVDVGPIPDRADGRRELDLDPTPGPEVVIGFVGRLSSQKNVGLLIDAYANARSRATAPSRLIVVGTGEEEALVRERVEVNDLGDHVWLAGYRHGARAMAAFDVFALPSRYEGFPYVLLEALAAGVPCVATDGCSAGLLLGDGQAGRLVDGSLDGSAEALGAALAELIDDPARRAAMGDAARERAAHYGVNAMVAATVDLYRDLLAARGRAGSG